MSDRIPPALLEKIKERSKLKRSAIYNRINNKKRENDGLISKRAAAIKVALEFGINSATKYYTEDDKDILLRLRARPATDTRERVRIIRTKTEIKIDSLKGISCFDPLLPPKLIEEASLMAEKCYPILYIYENTIRNVIRILMEKVYGTDWWNKRVKPIHQTMDRTIETRIKTESDERWHYSRRGVHKIFYADLDHLRLIIEDNWNIFKQIHRRKSWVVEHIMQPGHSRNIIAHNNPLSKRDIMSINTKIMEWLDQIRGLILS